MGEGRSGRHVLSTVLLAGIALAATGLLVSNIQIADVGPEGESIQTFTNKIAGVMTSSLFILWGAIFIYVLIGLFNSRGKKAEVTASVGEYSWYRPLIGLLILAAFIALMEWSDLNVSLFNQGDGAQGGNQTAGGQTPPPIAGGSESGLFVLVFMSILFVSLVAVYFLYFRERDRDRNRYRLEGQDGRAQIGFVEDAMEELYRGDDFRSTIIRLYQHMCRLVKEDIRSDQRYMTPREFAGLATEKLRWPRGPVDELTSLFEEARYSSHDMDETRKNRAIRCLEDIRSAIDRRSDESAKGGIPAAGG